MSSGITIRVNPELLKEAIKKGVEKINIEIVLNEKISTRPSKERHENNFSYSGVETLSMRI